MSNHCIYIWSYRVLPDKLSDFIAAYNPNGEWADLFRHSPGYLGTELLSDRSDCQRFITIDRWESADTFQKFRTARAAEYEMLDAKCEAYTADEQRIGLYSDDLESER